MGVVVGLLENVPHQVLLVVLLLDQTHVQLHLPKKTASSALLRLLLLLALAGGSLEQNQLGAVEVEPGGDFFVPDLQNVPALGAHVSNGPVYLMGLNPQDSLQYLHRG